MKKKINQGFESPDRLNVLVTGTKVVGDIVADSNIRIDGEVKGNVVSSAKVVIGQSGILNGDLTCADADIEGEVNGTLKVDSLLSLRESAKILGDIKTGRFYVEEGASFTGSCTMGNAPRTTATSSADSKVESQEGMIY